MGYEIVDVQDELPPSETTVWGIFGNGECAKVHLDTRVGILPNKLGYRPPYDPAQAHWRNSVTDGICANGPKLWIRPTANDIKRGS